ncbi:hypothetical protein HPB47_022597 [Ixodes persulcatus]|uniref:Uncharacterized protein n=1 Tax=Ixodes persulcatus TaxID=34615 RepID=A0AC60Q996_IXOPE|nr:hypothetical protein HPB47_022597 [Ixodes persulcatus]
MAVGSCAIKLANIIIVFDSTSPGPEVNHIRKAAQAEDGMRQECSSDTNCPAGRHEGHLCPDLAQAGASSEPQPEPVDQANPPDETVPVLAEAVPQDAPAQLDISKKILGLFLALRFRGFLALRYREEAIEHKSLLCAFHRFQKGLAACQCPKRQFPAQYRLAPPAHRHSIQRAPQALPVEEAPPYRKPATLIPRVAPSAQKDTNSDVLWTWSYPCFTPEERSLLLPKCDLENDSLSSEQPVWFRYCHHHKDWFYMYQTEVFDSDNLSRVRLFVLVLHTRDFSPDKYETLARILSKVYCKTGDPTALLRLFLSVSVKGSCTTEENGTFLLKDFERRRSLTQVPIKDIIKMFGLEAIIIYTAIMLKKRMKERLPAIEDILASLQPLAGLPRLAVDDARGDPQQPWLEAANRATQSEPPLETLFLEEQLKPEEREERCRQAKNYGRTEGAMFVVPTIDDDVLRHARSQNVSLNFSGDRALKGVQMTNTAVTGPLAGILKSLQTEGSVDKEAIARHVGAATSMLSHTDSLVRNQRRELVLERLAPRLKGKGGQVPLSDEGPQLFEEGCLDRMQEENQSSMLWTPPVL